jgi:STE24 endopeptidase
VLSTAVGVFGIVGKSDVAGLPVLLLVGAAVQTASLPATNALSRAHERRADRFALTMTRNVPAFVSAMRRLATQNLSEDRPSPLVEILFLTHPTCTSRIAAAREWERAHGAGAG